MDCCNFECTGTSRNKIRCGGCRRRNIINCSICGTHMLDGRGARCQDCGRYVRSIMHKLAVSRYHWRKQEERRLFMKCIYCTKSLPKYKEKYCSPQCALRHLSVKRKIAYKRKKGIVLGLSTF